MANSYLDKTGLARLWEKIKSIVPTKISDLENDSDFATNSGTLSTVYANQTNNNEITLTDVAVIGYITSESKQLQFYIPYNVISGHVVINDLSLVVRAGSGQEYPYEASGNSNNVYTRLGSAPVSVWENGRTKRTNGVETLTAYVKPRSGIKVNVAFKNSLRKSQSSTVVNNNSVVAVNITASITLEEY